MSELTQTSHDIFNNISSFMLMTRKASSKNYSWPSSSITLNISMWTSYDWIFLSSNAIISNFDNLKVFRFNHFTWSCKMRFNSVIEFSIAVVLSSIDVDSELIKLRVIDIAIIDSLISYKSWFNDFIFLLIINSSMTEVLTVTSYFLNIFLLNNCCFHIYNKNSTSDTLLVIYSFFWMLY